ncbi:MAG: amidase [Verrucomicrobiota bacterium]
MTQNELTDFSANELARRVANKSVSASEVVKAYLERIEKRNTSINAYCTIAAESALEAASALDNEDAIAGPLHGVPVAIKDVTPTAGIRTTYGSKLYENHIPSRDDLVVSRLKAAGAIVIGKTNTSEFAAGAHATNALFGPTRNPWNTDLTAGGSTGGGAAALAARIAPLAEGSDMGGSLRIPAAFCGLVGLRPTVGLVPAVENAAPWDVIRTQGPMARTASEAALMLDVISGYASASPISAYKPQQSFAQTLQSEEPLSFAWCPRLSDLGIDQEIASITADAAKALESSGHRVEEVPLDLSDGREAFLALRGQFMMNHHLDKLDRLDELGPNLRGNIEQGMKVTSLDLAKAEKKRAEIYQRLEKIWGRFDLLLTPCMPIEPFPVEQNYPETINGKPMESYIDWVAQTFLLTLSSGPTASAPAGLTKNGLPVGIQIAGPRWEDGLVLRGAKAIENALGLLPPPPLE